MAIKVAQMDFDAARRLILRIFDWRNVDAQEIGIYDDDIGDCRWLYGRDSNLNLKFSRNSDSIKNAIWNCSGEIFIDSRLHAKAGLLNLLLGLERFAEIFGNIASDIDSTRKDVRFFSNKYSTKSAVSNLPIFRTSSRVRVADSIEAILDRTETQREKTSDKLDLNRVHDLLISIVALIQIGGSPCADSQWKEYPWKTNIYEDQNVKFLKAATRFDKVIERCQNALLADDELLLSNALFDLRNISMSIEKFLERIGNDAQSVLQSPGLDWPEFPEDYKLPIYWLRSVQ
jgi:hypothetical protein